MYDMGFGGSGFGGRRGRSSQDYSGGGPFQGFDPNQQQVWAKSSVITNGSDVDLGISNGSIAKWTNRNFMTGWSSMMKYFENWNAWWGRSVVIAFCMSMLRLISCRPFLKENFPPLGIKVLKVLGKLTLSICSKVSMTVYARSIFVITSADQPCSSSITPKQEENLPDSCIVTESSLASVGFGDRKQNLDIRIVLPFIGRKKLHACWLFSMNLVLHSVFRCICWTDSNWPLQEENRLDGWQRPHIVDVSGLSTLSADWHCWLEMRCQLGNETARWCRNLGNSWFEKRAVRICRWRRNSNSSFESDIL